MMMTRTPITAPTARINMFRDDDTREIFITGIIITGAMLVLIFI